MFHWRCFRFASHAVVETMFDDGCCVRFKLAKGRSRPVDVAEVRFISLACRHFNPRLPSRMVLSLALFAVLNFSIVGHTG